MDFSEIANNIRKEKWAKNVREAIAAGFEQTDAKLTEKKWNVSETQPSSNQQTILDTYFPDETEEVKIILATSSTSTSNVVLYQNNQPTLTLGVLVAIANGWIYIKKINGSYIEIIANNKACVVQAESIGQIKIELRDEGSSIPSSSKIWILTK
ncbi:hypothetical protein [uncultured Eubacterium sp.]|uniref:hypothetical protein n=1 Tax=uncultured Eubacterium sp. TaxID=165185 RepID=UPI0026735ACF|nr:hypothetical protein [uncultured Eubacterium sp.]